MAVKKEAFKAYMEESGLSSGIINRLLLQLNNLSSDQCYCDIALGGIGNNGHASERHFGLEDWELQARAQNRRHRYTLVDPFCASSFLADNLLEVGRLVTDVIADEANWSAVVGLVKGSFDRIELYHESDAPIGKGAYTGAYRDRTYALSKVCVVLARAAYEPLLVVTAFPCATVEEQSVAIIDIATLHPWLVKGKAK